MDFWPDPFRARRIWLLGVRRPNNSRTTPQLELSKSAWWRNYSRYVVPLALRHGTSFWTGTGRPMRRRNPRPEAVE